MLENTNMLERRTAADAVFERLYQEIASLELLPGTKLSEADVARRFEVSRQPVREAFGRLGNLDLLLVRPQRATVVRGFSMERVAHVRFIRLAVRQRQTPTLCSAPLWRSYWCALDNAGNPLKPLCQQQFPWTRLPAADACLRLRQWQQTHRLQQFSATAHLQ